MAVGNLEQALGVNPFGEQINVERKPENVQEVKMPIILHEAVEKTIQQYDTSYNAHIFEPGKFSESQLIILTPMQIELVLQNIIDREPLTGWEVMHKGVFLSLLIQKSYDAGNNNFSLITYDTTIDSIGNNLNGIFENPLTLLVNGNVGVNFGEKSENCIYTVHGNAGLFFGCNSKNCVYNIHGNVGSSYGHKNAWNNIYKTSKINTYYSLIRQFSIGNTIQMLDKNGKIIVEHK